MRTCSSSLIRVSLLISKLCTSLLRSNMVGCPERSIKEGVSFGGGNVLSLDCGGVCRTSTPCDERVSENDLVPNRLREREVLESERITSLGVK